MLSANQPTAAQTRTGHLHIVRRAAMPKPNSADERASMTAYPSSHQPLLLGGQGLATGCCWFAPALPWLMGQMLMLAGFHRLVFPHAGHKTFFCSCILAHVEVALVPNRSDPGCL